MKHPGSGSDPKKLFNFTHSEQDDELVSILEKLNSNFLKYKTEIRSYFQRCFQGGTTEGLHSWSKNLPKDEINEVIKKLIPFVSSHENVESIHKIFSYSLQEYLSADIDPLSNSLEVSRTELLISEDLGTSIPRDNFLSLLENICGFLKTKIQRLTIQLVFLFEEEQQSEKMRFKKIVNLLAGMGRTKILTSKMGIQDQIKSIIQERQKIIDLYTLLKIDTNNSPLFELDVKLKNRSSNAIKDYFEAHNDLKDYAIVEIEEQSLNYLEEKILKETSHYKGDYVQEFIRVLPELLYARDYSYTATRHYTLSCVESDYFMPQKSSEDSNQKTSTLDQPRNNSKILGSSPKISKPERSSSPEKNKNTNNPNSKQNNSKKPEYYFTKNFMREVLSKAGALKLLCYKSNSFFDNVSVSELSLDSLYHSYSFKTPKIVLILKNLQGNYIDEIDVFEDLIADCPYDSRISSVREICEDFSKEIRKDFIRPKFKTNFDLVLKDLSPTQKFDLACKKYSTSHESIFGLLNLIDSNFSEVFELQSQLLTFVDSKNREKVMEDGILSMKFTNEKNPNMDMMNRATSLNKETTLGVVNLTEKFKTPSMKKVIRPYETIKELERKNLHLSQRVSALVEALKTPCASLVQEKMEAFLYDHVSKLPIKETDSYFKSVIYLEKAFFKLVALGTRTSIIRLVSYSNYFTSIQLRMAKKLENLKKADTYFDNIEQIRPVKPEEQKKNDKRIGKIEFRDDSFLNDSQVSSRFLDATLNRDSKMRRKSVGGLSKIGEEDAGGTNILQGLSQGSRNNLSDDGAGDQGSQKYSSSDSDMNDSVNLLSSPVKPSVQRVPSRGKLQLTRQTSSPSTIFNANKLLLGPSPSPHKRVLKKQSSGHENTCFKDKTIIQGTYHKKNGSQDDNRKRHISRVDDEEELADVIKFDRDLGALLVNESQNTFIVRITDINNNAIVYDKALSDFKTVEGNIEKIISFFIENNLVDYCFNAIETEDFELKIGSQSKSQNHLRMKVKQAPSSLNIEYIVQKVYKAEADFQARKVELIEAMYELFPHLGTQQAVDDLIKSINMIISKRPPIDFAAFDMLNEELSEICNSKVSMSDINIRSIAQEVQNYIITIFDGYSTGITYFDKYLELYNKLNKGLKQLDKKVGYLKDKGTSPLNLLRHQTLPYQQFLENVDFLSKLHLQLDEGVTHLTQDLLDYKTIDQLSFTESVIENNAKLYYKSVGIKYFNDNRKQASTTIFGRGIKEASNLYYLRLFLVNRLERRKNLLKGSLEISMLEEISQEWSNISDGFSTFLMAQESEVMLKEVPSLQKDVSKKLKDISKMREAFRKEKRLQILQNKTNHWDIMRTQSKYSQKEFENSLKNLNLLHSVTFFLDKQSGIRKNLNNFEPLGRLDYYQKMMSKSKIARWSPRRAAYDSFKQNFEGKRILTLKFSNLKRIMKITPLELWKEEKLIKNVAFLADSKAFFEFLTLTDHLYRTSLYSNNLCHCSLIQENLYFASNILTNKHIAEKVITNIDISFGKRPPMHSSRGMNPRMGGGTTSVGRSTKRMMSSSILEDPVYITNSQSHGPTEIKFKSRNESILRRLISQVVTDFCPEQFVSPQNILMRIQRKCNYFEKQKMRNVNYIVEEEALKKYQRKREAMRKNPNIEPSSLVKPHRILRLSSCPYLSTFFIYMNRMVLVVAARMDIFRQQNKIEREVRTFSNWLTPVLKNVTSFFQFANLNLNFWRSIADTQVDYTALNLLDIYKSLQESFDDIKNVEKVNKEAFNNHFPGFFDVKNLEAGNVSRVFQSGGGVQDPIASQVRRSSIQASGKEMGIGMGVQASDKLLQFQQEQLVTEGNILEDIEENSSLNIEASEKSLEKVDGVQQEDSQEENTKSIQENEAEPEDPPKQDPLLQSVVSGSIENSKSPKSQKNMDRPPIYQQTRGKKTSSSIPISSQAYYKLLNVEEIGEMLENDISSFLMASPIKSEELLFRTERLCAFELPEGLFKTGTQIHEKKKQTLSKLIGKSSSQRLKVNQGTKSNKFDAQKYNDVSAYAKNFYNNCLDFLLERVLLKSGFGDEGAEEDYSRKSLSSVLKEVQLLKFRTNLRGVVIDDEKQEILKEHEETNASKNTRVSSLLNTSDTIAYSRKLDSISQLIRTYIFKLSLKHNHFQDETRPPTWILKYLKSPEFDLVYKGDFASSKSESQKRLELLKGMSIRLINFKKLQELYSDSDHRQANAVTRVKSKLAQKLKDKGLHSVFYSRTYIDNPLRNFDLRLKVYLFELARSEKKCLDYRHNFLEFLKSHQSPQKELKEELEILKEKTRSIQSEIILSVYDLLGGLKWELSSQNGIDSGQSKKKAEEHYYWLQELLQIFKGEVYDGSGVTQGSQRTKQLQRGLREPLFLKEKELRVRNSNMEKVYQSDMISNIDILHRMINPCFKGQNNPSYCTNRGYSSNNVKFQLLMDWVDKAPNFTKDTLLAKISTAVDNWKTYKNKKVQNLFEHAQKSGQDLAEQSLLDNGEIGEEEINKDSNFIRRPLQELKRRKLFLNFQIRAFEIIELLSQKPSLPNLSLYSVSKDVENLVDRNKFTFKAPISKNSTFKFKESVTDHAIRFREMISEMGIQHLVVAKRNKEILNAIQIYEERTKKTFNQTIKYESFDHFYHLEMNFSHINQFMEEDYTHCHLEESQDFLAMMRDGFSEASTTGSCDPEFNGIQDSKSHLLTPDDSLCQRLLGGTFISNNFEHVLCNIGFLMKKSVKSMIEEQAEQFGLSAIFFRRVNDSMNSVNLKRKLAKRRLVGSRNILPSISNVMLDYNLKGGAPNMLTSFSKGSWDRQVSSSVGQSAPMAILLSEIQNQDLLPFMVAFMEQIIDKSCNITTKNETSYYLLDRSFFVKAMATLIEAGICYFREVESSIYYIYRSLLQKGTSFLQSRREKMRSVSYSFGQFMEGFHKLVEAELSEDNFRAIYSIEEVAKNLKHSHYDILLAFKRLKEKVLCKYEPEMYKLYLSKKYFQDLKENYDERLALDMKEFVAETHNQNMKSIRGKLESIMEDKVTLYDVELNKNVEDEDIEEILDDEQLTKITQFKTLMNHRLSSVLDQKISQNEKKTKQFKEKLIAGENLFIKIRELLQKETVLQKELNNSKYEIKHLSYQNQVLDKDIHTCNLERVNLTKRIERQKETLLKLEEDKQRFLMTKSSTYRGDRVTSRIDTGSTNRSPVKTFKQRRSKMGVLAEEGRRDSSNKMSSMGSEMSDQLKTLGVLGKGGRKSKKGKGSTNQNRSSSKIKSRSKYTFKNGKMEMKFRIRQF